MNFHDLNAQYQALKPQIDEGIAEVIKGGHFILGGQVSELEARLAEDTGRNYCVTCGNGTDALVLLLMLWGVGPGDAVFAPDFTYFASAACAAAVGASAVPVDICLNTFNLSPEALETAILRVQQEGRLRPRVVVAVDLFGQPAQYDRLSAIAKKYHLLLLEDGAQGYGGSINGKAACSFGDAAITSFFPAKPLGCYGDGGAVFVDTQEEADLLRSLRANGRGKQDKYDNQRFGMNSRLDTLQAAILLPKLDALRRYELSAVNHAAQRYTDRLTGAVTVPYVPVGYTSSWAQYTVLLESEKQRDEAQKALKEQDIPSMVYYPRGLHRQSAFSDRDFSDSDYPNTLNACERVLSLPMHPYLTDSEIDRVSDVLLDFVRRNEYAPHP
ncbi:MAG: DegT/DnrJ/EryC1/StrS family aminotransferase [Eubacteriales bacterium]|nr:DegT/DnrJ/EryC1/StrS family aminotransferase [Eubacteriales bacterium]